MQYLFRVIGRCLLVIHHALWIPISLGPTDHYSPIGALPSNIPETTNVSELYLSHHLFFCESQLILKYGDFTYKYIYFLKVDYENIIYYSFNWYENRYNPTNKVQECCITCVSMMREEKGYQKSDTGNIEASFLFL